MSSHHESGTRSVTRFCVICGARLNGRPQAKTCSDRCRRALSRRQKDASGRDQSVTLEQAVESFLRAKTVEGRSLETIKAYASILGQLAHKMPGKPIDAISADEIRQFFAEARNQITRYKNAVQRPEIPGRLSAETLRSRVRQFKVFFAWCEMEYSLSAAANPMRKIELPRGSQRAPKAIHLDDLRKMFEATAGDTTPQGLRDRALLFFLADTGARAAGACTLTPDRLNLTEHYAILLEKGDRARAVPFTEATAEALSRWLAVRPSSARTVFCALGPAPASILHGGILTTNGLYQAVKRIARRAGIAGRFNPHSLRHGFAREFLQRGGDLATLSQIMGHSSVNVTVGFYAVFTTGELVKRHALFSPINSLVPDSSPVEGK